MAYAQSLAFVERTNTVFSSNLSGLSLSSPELKERIVPQVAVTPPDPLVQKLREGDEKTYGDLIEKYHSSMIRMARQYVPTQAIAEEVVQETWVAFLESLQRFEGRCSIKTWLLRILINRAKTRGVQERRHIALTGETQTKEGPQPSDNHVGTLNANQHHHNSWRSLPQSYEYADPEKTFLTKEWVTYLQSAIQSLPPRQQQIILLEGRGRVDLGGSSCSSPSLSRKINESYFIGPEPACAMSSRRSFSHQNHAPVIKKSRNENQAPHTVGHIYMKPPKRFGSDRSALTSLKAFRKPQVRVEKEKHDANTMLD